MKTSLEFFGWLNSFQESLEFMENYKDVEAISDAYLILNISDNFHSFCSSCRKVGLLSCKPTLSKDSNSIVYGAGKYLHRFSGYYYQISSTQTGTGSGKHSMFRMDYLLEAIDVLECDDRKSASAFILAMAMLTTAYIYYDETVGALKSNEEVFDNLLATNKSSIASITDFTTINTYTFPSMTEEDMLLLYSNKVYAIFRCNVDSMQLQIREGAESYTCFTLRYPVWIKDIKEEDLHLFHKAFVEYLLHAAGIRASHRIMRPIVTMHHPKREFNINNTTQARTFQEVLDYVNRRT